MTLTASDVASLSRKLSCWEFAEYAFAALVAVACAGEYVADFTDWFTCGEREAKDRLAKRSTLLLIAALAFELACLVKTNSLSARLTGSLSEKAELADTHAQAAIDKSAIAETKSSGAMSKATEVEGKVEAAKNAAGDARKEADRVAVQANQLRKEVVALSPRTLTLDQQRDIVSALKQFRGLHPTIIESYGMDGEGTALATQLLGVFQAVGAFPLTDDRADQIVSGGFEWGISIRGPSYEMPFMVAIRDALCSTGKLRQVLINGLSPPLGVQVSGGVTFGGNVVIGGGGGVPRQQPIPTAGPVRILVGIRPPTVFPNNGKQ